MIYKSWACYYIVFLRHSLWEVKSIIKQWYFSSAELVAPDISKLPDKAAIQDEDFQVQLYCNATGHPKPTLTWYFERNGEKVHINEKGEGLGGNVDACRKRTSGYFFLVDRNPSDLVICRPKLQHIGKYTCRASSPRFKYKEQSAFINVFSE